MDARLLDVLVCPICKRPLDYDKKAQELICRPDKLAYPIRDGIPIMWPDDARDLNAATLVGPAGAEDPLAGSQAEVPPGLKPGAPSGPDMSGA